MPLAVLISLASLLFDSRPKRQDRRTDHSPNQIRSALQ